MIGRLGSTWRILVAWRRRRLLRAIVSTPNRRKGVRHVSSLARLKAPAAMAGLVGVGALLMWGWAMWQPVAPPATSTASSPRQRGTVTIVWPEGQTTIGASNLVGRASVIDGDTIEVRRQRIRLWGIDAPESSQIWQRDGRPWQCGRDAAMALSDWLGARTVTCEERTRDQYGRIVALCYVGGVDVSAWLVDNGWALAFRRYSEDYITNERRARAARRGMWASEFQVPWEWRARQR